MIKCEIRSGPATRVFVRLVRIAVGSERDIGGRRKEETEVV